MNYKQAYYKLLTTVLDDEKASASTFEKAEEINDQINKEPTENKPSDAERKREIMSIRDATERQQAIQQNMELFR